VRIRRVFTISDSPDGRIGSATSSFSSFFLACIFFTLRLFCTNFSFFATSKKAFFCTFCNFFREHAHIFNCLKLFYRIQRLKIYKKWFFLACSNFYPKKSLPPELSCACVRACVRARVRVCVYVCVRVYYMNQNNPLFLQLIATSVSCNYPCRTGYRELYPCLPSVHGS